MLQQFCLSSSVTVVHHVECVRLFHLVVPSV